MSENKLLGLSFEFPKRKHPRLDNYDYSLPGAYFITVCTQNRKRILSHIVGYEINSVEIKLTNNGEIAEEQLFLLEKRYSHLKIDKYVIMPDHIDYL